MCIFVPISSYIYSVAVRTRERVIMCVFCYVAIDMIRNNIIRIRIADVSKVQSINHPTLVIVCGS